MNKSFKPKTIEGKRKIMHIDRFFLNKFDIYKQKIKAILKPKRPIIVAALYQISMFVKLDEACNKAPDIFGNENSKEVIKKI